ncbi:MAG TPA: transcriptional regulator [Candidatus Baltobacteraceae bacterium]|jgi:DNA-binding MarR family transcriptional regulator|nr:transcriptional regulator [Candidatus Baltobacteraceae bacterium]
MDELLLSKVRLGIIAELLSSEWVSFSALVRAVQTTNGNLGAHLGKLIDAGYVEEAKAFVDRRPQSSYQLTPTGRAAFIEHVRHMQSLLEA